MHNPKQVVLEATFQELVKQWRLETRGRQKGYQW